jgi:hypothetical protein
MHCFLLKFKLRCIICPLLETVGLQVPARYVRHFSLFNVCSSRKTVFLLDALQLLKLSVIWNQHFLAAIFYNGTFIIIKMILVFNTNYIIVGRV